MVKRAHARFLRDVEREARKRRVFVLLVNQDVLGESVLKLEPQIVSELPNNESILIFEVVVERFAVLTRALNDVADGNLLQRLLFAQLHKRIGN